MAVDLYQPFTNPVTRETFRCLASTEESYRTEWTVQPGGFVPFEHIHLNQDEIFHIKRGRMRARLDGRECTGAAGETLIVPRGTRHIACNDGAEALHCVLEYRPGLDSFKVFQCFGGLTRDGRLDRRGIVDPPKMLYFLQKMRARAVARPAYVPDPVFGLLMRIFYLTGEMAGWEGLYRKYTG